MSTYIHPGPLKPNKRDRTIGQPLDALAVPDALLTIRTTCAVTGQSESSLRRGVRAGTFPAPVRRGGTVYPLRCASSLYLAPCAAEGHRMSAAFRALVAATRDAHGRGEDITEAEISAFIKAFGRDAVIAALRLQADAQLAEAAALEGYGALKRAKGGWK